ncbi:hypothetical protein GJ744_012141 [Endocarpon pusillum]|uniref:Uncharacterized protein n=1 Tax=Endocarpon pusillum TaxID=364733 RepID=A0A8H7AFG5_9EURO|nr:hypothetical protein GJ744_012141 [Endocarpon pusillum]
MTHALLPRNQGAHFAPSARAARSSPATHCVSALALHMTMKKRFAILYGRSISDLINPYRNEIEIPHIVQPIYPLYNIIMQIVRFALSHGCLVEIQGKRTRQKILRERTGDQSVPLFTTRIGMRVALAGTLPASGGAKNEHLSLATVFQIP